MRVPTSITLADCSQLGGFTRMFKRLLCCLLSLLNQIHRCMINWPRTKSLLLKFQDTMPWTQQDVVHIHLLLRFLRGWKISPPDLWPVSGLELRIYTFFEEFTAVRVTEHIENVTQSPANLLKSWNESSKQVGLLLAWQRLLSSAALKKSWVIGQTIHIHLTHGEMAI